MSVLRRSQALERRTASLGALLEAAGRGRSAAGVTVTTDTAMRQKAVWAVVMLGADLISTLPVDVVRYVGGARVPIEKAPPLIAKPSATVSRIAWMTQLVVSLLMRGNAYGLVTSRDGAGYPMTIELLHPDDVQVRLRGTPALADWFVCGKPVPADDVFHVAENLFPGSPVGLSPVEYLRLTIGTGLAAEDFLGRFYADGAHPTASLSTDKPVDGPQAQAIKDRFMSAVNGSREPVVLGNGFEFKPIQLTPADAQFLDAIKATKNDIAAAWRMPPEMVGGDSGGSLTYSNVESQSLRLLRDFAAPRIVRIEEALSACLPRAQVVKFNTDALARTDLATKYRVLGDGIRSGIHSVNEARQKLDQAPIDGGDEYLWPPYRAFPLSTDGDTTTPGA